MRQRWIDRQISLMEKIKLKELKLTSYLGKKYYYLLIRDEKFYFIFFFKNEPKNMKKKQKAKNTKEMSITYVCVFYVSFFVHLVLQKKFFCLN